MAHPRVGSWWCSRPRAPGVTSPKRGGSWARQPALWYEHSGGWIMAFRSVLAFVFFAGCSGSDKPTAPPSPRPPPPSGIAYPVHHAEPAWSSRGLIAYRDNGVVSVARSGAYDTDSSLEGLWLLNPTTGARRRLLPFGESPAWAPDGSTLAFEWGGQIFRVSADSSDLRQLTFSGFNFHPCWHPSGREITFDRYATSWSDGAQIYSINSEGGTPNLVCDAPGGERRSPDWHPDGRRLAVAWNRGAPYYRFHIYAVDTASCAAYRVSYESHATNYHPRFSPDGNEIVFSCQVDAHPGPPTLWLVDRWGRSRQLTTAGGDEPTWSPDGQWVAFRNDEWEYSTRERVLWMVNVSDGRLVQLTNQWVTPCDDPTYIACRKSSIGSSVGAAHAAAP